MSTRVAAIDCGTNSIRLLVADVDAGRLTDVLRRMEIVRLGAGVDRTGRLADDALRRTFDAIDDYARVIRRLGAAHLRMVATSATRDASNSDVFVEGVVGRLGVLPEVITGDDEAALSFEGATGDLRRVRQFPAPYLVCDIGGGSTEFVVGDDTGMRAARSTDIGCVRMTERHLHDDPPTPTQIAAARADIEVAIDEAAGWVPMDEARTLIGLAGSVTTVAALALGLDAYLPERIHHSRVSADEVRRISDMLLAMTHAQRAALPVMHPGRVDVIAAGALILDTVIHRRRFPTVVASEHDILDGIALSAARSLP